MKQFDIPFTYRSPLISEIKTRRKEMDKLKKDFTPTLLDYGPVKIYLARHFGFCYGVENAIEIAFRTVDENPGKRIFLLSEMIHNPQVNLDLQERGVRFLQDTLGNPLISLDEISTDDVVLIPAFGTTLSMEKTLRDKGIAVEKFDTTCPFVEKVWNRSEQIARKGYTVIVHGKPSHEETRATFSHASEHAPTLVINDMNEAQVLGEYISGSRIFDDFHQVFNGRTSAGFDPGTHLQRIGVVNQTTMLASDTQDIANYLKTVIERKYGAENGNFADTRDTLCYATNDNQSAVYGMLDQPADLAIVVGGYNSSNTSHLVELCEARLPTYFINDANNISNDRSIRHFDLHSHSEVITSSFLPESSPATILITSGASCPDAVVEGVIVKTLNLFSIENVMAFS